MQEIIDFVLELEKLKGVTRKTKPLGLERYENSAEHSWQLALMAMAMEKYAVEAVEINRVVRMLLVHDVGEIDAGDTMVFVEGGWEERKAKELAGVTRVFSMLPEGRGAELLELWKEFEEEITAEARFAHSVDRAMPVLLNLNNGGQSWKENGISYERVVGRIAGQIKAGCPPLWSYLEEQLEEAKRAGLFGA
ncbi:MAG TPA: HD domain-containing protein [Candidatus Acidoferrum sp.]|jgi:putative hydrolase of HD superfamily